MRKAKRIILLVVVVLVLGLAALFYIQNKGQLTPLYFDLGFWGLQSSTKWPVPALMYISFAAGLAVMGVYTIIQRIQLGGRRRERRDAPVDDMDQYEF
jgi:hypothetical protein